MPTLFSTSLYQQAVGVDTKTLEFNAGDTTLTVLYSVDEKTSHFHIGKQSTFGHIEFTGAEDYTSICACFDLLFEHIHQHHQRFTIKFAPSFHFQNISDHIGMVLKNLDKVTLTEDCNQSMVITNGIDVVDNFGRSNRRIYRKLERNGYVVRRSNTLLAEGYALLEENRQNRNVTLSLSYDALEAQVQKLHGYFHFFECRTANDMLNAYAVTLKLSSDWLYVFYWGEKLSDRKSSPIVILAAEIMRYCQQENITRLDAGTSSVAGIVDQTLFDFKRRLGFMPSPKLVLCACS